MVSPWKLRNQMDMKTVGTVLFCFFTISIIVIVKINWCPFSP